MKSFWRSLHPLAWLIAVGACTPEEVYFDVLTTLDYEGQVTRIEYLGEYSDLDAMQFLQLAVTSPAAPITTTNDFSLYRYSYYTLNYDSSEVLVSGLVGVPHTEEIKGLVSWQHGTNTYRPGSISSPSPDEGIGLGALFCGDGYVLVAADYIGLGISTEVHPYYHMESTTRTVVDLLRIGETVLNALTNDANMQLFLAGFSQGGGASVAVQRYLEEGNPTQLELKGTAAISGAYNLDEISFPYALQNKSINSMTYIGLAANAFAHIYNEPVDHIIQPSFADQVSSWFDGTKGADFLTENLPDSLSAFVQPAFIQAIENRDSNHWMVRAIQENEIYQFVPQHELRLYYGSADKDVSPEDSQDAYQYMQANGGNVKIFNLGPFSHDESILEALPYVKDWFDEIHER
ncbi:MAG: lipase family protein [Bacteroidota bacterium]